MGADLNRGILLFSEPKRIGEEGLWWLKVHFANKWGKDKLPLHERARFAETMEEVIHKCADDPKTNLDWLQAENPW